MTKTPAPVVPASAPQPPALDADCTPRRRGRPRKTTEGSARRSELLAIAARHFRLRGFDATTVRDIAAESGMQSGSPFYHFKTKNELLFSVMADGMLAALQGQHAVLSRLPTQADACQRLKTLALHHLQVLLTPGNDFIAVMLYEQRALSQGERLQIRTLKDEYELAWHQQLQELQDQGRLRAPASLTRLMFFGAMHGTLSWYDPAKGLSLPDLASQLMAVFVASADSPLPVTATAASTAPDDAAVPRPPRTRR